MKLYVLDTSVCGFVQNEHPVVMRRLHEAQARSDEIVTTIVTFGEDLGGWLPACRRAVHGAERAQAYGRLQRGLNFYQTKDCLPFDALVASVFDQLKAQRIRVSTNDLAIAAITLSVNGVLITRNAVDFIRIPNLVFEDWTR